MHAVAILGYGNVGRALAALLDEKRAALRERHGIGFELVGTASRRQGFVARGARFEGVEAWLDAARPDVLFECTSLEPLSGANAVLHCRAALERGAHVITANKGAVVFGYRELEALAAARGRRFLFEATVMGGAPFFSLVRETLPALEIRRVRGILNSTTNLVLGEMEAGRSLEEGVAAAARHGLTETDPTHDLDGWDAAAKLAIVAQVLMGADLKTGDVHRQGIRALDAAEVRAAPAKGRTWKLVAEVARTAAGVAARVQPIPVAVSDPLASAKGAAMIAEIETDVLPGVGVVARDAGPRETAYDMLADFVTAVR